MKYGCLPDIEPGRCDPLLLEELLEQFPWAADDEIVQLAKEEAGIE